MPINWDSAMMDDTYLTVLTMENHHPSTMLSMDSSASSHDELELEMNHHVVLPGPPDINLPLSSERSPPPQQWNLEPADILEVGLGPQIYGTEGYLNLPKPVRKCAKRMDSIWGAWFFFSFYFKPVLHEKSKGKVIRDGNGVSGFDKSDLVLDTFLVQHDMENLYMWTFKERPENALGKMQLRSYMNGHSRQGEPAFPFSAEKGFVRSHRMQRKHYRGLSNPQCLHGIEPVFAPNLLCVDEEELKRWIELIGREMNFKIPTEACDYSVWRNLPNTDFELERAPAPLKGNLNSHPKRLLNGSGLNLSTPVVNLIGSEGIEMSPICTKRRKDLFPNGNNDDDCYLTVNPPSERVADVVDVHQNDPLWLHDFTGVMRNACGPVTACKSIYEDEEGYLIIVSLPFVDLHKVKVSWRNTLTHGIIKISCVSTSRVPFLKRRDRTFKLTDPSPEHCPPGEFIREIPLTTRIPEDAKIEAFYDNSGTILEIMVPKLHAGPEEHEVHVSLRPPLEPMNLC